MFPLTVVESMVVARFLYTATPRWIVPNCQYAHLNWIPLGSVRTLAGHSHWHNIRHRKARADASRAALFQKLSLAITAAARQENVEGVGRRAGDIGPKLSRALEEARKHSLPRARIDTALAVAADKHAASTSIANHDALYVAINSRVYEAEFPDGIGMLVRLACPPGEAPRHGVSQELRGIFERAGGKAQRVAWMFTEEWTVVALCSTGAQDGIAELGINAGAENVDIDEEEGCVRFLAEDRKQAAAIKQALSASVPPVDNVEVHMSVQSKDGGKIIAEEAAKKFRMLINKLEAREDFLDVVHNASLPS